MEERLFADAADGRLNEFSLLDAALVASGVDSDDLLRQYRQKAAALVDQLRCSEKEKLSDAPRQRIETIFAFMHRRVLAGGYDLAYTDLRRVLQNGRFNCVSSTVLFNYLAGQLGVDCRAVAMPGHAMARVVLPGSVLDVETTCPQWFSLKDSPRQPPTTATKTIGAAAVADHTQSREVSPIQLAAMIYYNRGVDRLAEKRFAEATSANAKALRLDPQNATARGNLLATINNWSIEMADSRQFAEAADLLRRGLAMDRKFAAFAQNYVHVHRQWADQLCRQRRFDEARAMLSKAIAEMPDRDELRKIYNDVRVLSAK